MSRPVAPAMDDGVRELQPWNKTSLRSSIRSSIGCEDGMGRADTSGHIKSRGTRTIWCIPASHRGVLDKLQKLNPTSPAAAANGGTIQG